MAVDGARPASEADAEIGARLAAVTPEQWRQIAAAQHGLAGAGPFGTWGGGERQPDGAIQLPFAIEGAEIRAAREALGQAGLAVAFDWPRWTEGRALAADRDRWGEWDPVTAVKLWVAVVRNARFNEGALLSAADDGLLAAILAGVLRARGASERA